MALTEHQFHRYARHLILDEIGEDGQEKLLRSHVLVVGAGGLGSPVLMYLAAAGVGTLGIVDDDKVDVTNLQRQIVHMTEHVGVDKVKSAVLTLAEVNPDTRVIPYKLRVDASNVMDLIEPFDLVIDGSDNFSTRYLLNDACHFARKPLVAASLLRFEGQLSTFRAWDKGPCYRCLFPDRPPPDLITRCEEAGILGSVAGVMGTLQATEAIKELIGLGDGLAGRLLIYDALGATFRTIAVPKDPACRLCGTAPAIRDLSIHQAR